MNWVVGHIVANRNSVIELLGVELAFDSPLAWGHARPTN
jgi:hypothetical protein